MAAPLLGNLICVASGIKVQDITDEIKRGGDALGDTAMFSAALPRGAGERTGGGCCWLPK